MIQNLRKLELFYHSINLSDQLLSLDTTKLIKKDIKEKTNNTTNESTGDLSKFIKFNLINSNNLNIYKIVDDLLGKIVSCESSNEIKIKYLELIKEYLVYNLINKKDTIVKENLYIAVYIEILIMTSFKFKLDTCIQFKEKIKDNMVSK